MYGPPASGKTPARNIACDKIREIFRESGTIKDIFESFVDTSIDDIVYQTKHKNSNEKMLNVFKKLYETNIQKILSEQKEVVVSDGNYANKENIGLVKLLKQNIKTFADATYKEYTDSRNDSVSELLYYFAIFMNKNIFFEVASGNIGGYINKIISSMAYYNYIPVIIYPVVYNVNTLFDRSVERGMKEGRFILCDTGYGISAKMRLSLIDFPALKKFIIDTNKEYLSIQYKADMSKDDYDKIVKCKFSSDIFDKYILDISYSISTKNKTTDTDKLERVEFNEKINTYDKQIAQLIYECKKYE